MKAFRVIMYFLTATAILAFFASSTNAATNQVETPTFNPSSGIYFGTQSVSISCGTSGAKIYYTMDGSEPTSKSNVYSKPISVNSDATIKAKAAKTSLIDSETASATYVILFDKVEAPTFDPPGDSYYSSLNVAINCATSGATICYTLDGSEPTSKSTSYSMPILVSKDVTVKAKAFVTGMVSSDTVSANYVIKPISAPTFNPAGGVFTLTESASVIVYINCSTNGASIRYTFDGSEPTASSILYTGQVTINSNVTIKAKAILNSVESSTTSASYTVFIIQPTTVSTPIFDLAEGFYANPQNVTIQCSTAGAIIHYTIDGSEPTINSSVYSGPIFVNSTTAFKAKAFHGGFLDSSTAVATYTFGSSLSNLDSSNDRSLALVLFIVLILCFVGFMLFYNRS